VYSLYIFFFQAEDGIRDFHVTGVQTCALPISEAFAAAAATADWTSVQDFNLVITNAPGEQAWPITATNFILMYKQPADPQRSAAAREFFTWALENGQRQAAELDYVPLPPELVGQIEQYWAAEFKSAP